MEPPYFSIRFNSSCIPLSINHNPLNIGEISRGLSKKGYNWLVFNTIEERQNGLQKLEIYVKSYNIDFRYSLCLRQLAELYKSKCSPLEYKGKIFYYSGKGFNKE
jgi:hypothetical protein